MITIKEVYTYGIQIYTVTQDWAKELIGQSPTFEVGQEYNYDGSRFIILAVK